MAGTNITSRSLTLQWIEPHDSNAPIQGYYVRYREPGFTGGAEIELQSSEPARLVQNLLPGITYNFTVFAFNEIGESQPSATAPVRTLDEGWWLEL